jgi:hypothetical protein
MTASHRQVKQCIMFSLSYGRCRWYQPCTAGSVVKVETKWKSNILQGMDCKYPAQYDGVDTIDTEMAVIRADMPNSIKRSNSSRLHTYFEVRFTQILPGMAIFGLHSLCRTLECRH